MVPQGSPRLGAWAPVLFLDSSWPRYPLPHDDFLEAPKSFLFHTQARNELMNSGLYLVLLLHLYELRFAELMRLNHTRVAQERVSLALPGPGGSLPTDLGVRLIRCASVGSLRSRGRIWYCHHQD